jgi:hypothetical protein
MTRCRVLELGKDRGWTLQGPSHRHMRRSGRNSKSLARLRRDRLCVDLCSGPLSLTVTITKSMHGEDYELAIDHSADRTTRDISHHEHPPMRRQEAQMTVETFGSGPSFAERC